MRVWVAYTESGAYSSFSVAIDGVFATREAAMNSFREYVERCRHEASRIYVRADSYAENRRTAWHRAEWKEDQDGRLEFTVPEMEWNAIVEPFEVQP